VQHRPAPDHRRVGVGQKAHAHHLQPEDFEGDQLLIRRDRRLREAQPDHLGDVGAEDVGVHQADARAALGQGHRQVDGDRALAHASLATAHRHNAAQREPHLPEDAAIGGHVRRPLDRHVADAIHLLDSLLRSLVDHVLERAGGRRQHDREMGHAIFHAHIADHLQRHQIAMKLRLDHRS